MASSILGKAYVEIHADFSQFDREVATKLKAAFAGAENLADDSGEKVGKKFSKKVGDELEKGGKKAGAKLGDTIGDETEKSSRRGVKRLTGSLQDAISTFAKSTTGLLGELFSRGIPETIGMGIKAIPNEVKAAIGVALLAVAAATAVFIGAAINGLLLATLGGGIIALGIAGAFKDTRIKNALGELKKEVVEPFKDLSSVFVDPLVDAFGFISESLTKKFFPVLRDGFERLAPLTRDLGKGLGGFFEKLGPGLAEGLKAAQPAVQALAQQLPAIGRAVGDFFRIIAKEKDGAVLGLVALVQGFNRIFEFIGHVVAFLSAGFESFVRKTAAVLGFLSKIPGLGELKGVKDMYKGLLDTLDDVNAVQETTSTSAAQTASEFQKQADAVNAANVSFQKFYQTSLTVDQSNLQFQASLDAVTASVKENGHSIDDNTAKGRANRQAALDSITAIIGLRDAQLANGAGVDKANAAYLRNIEALRGSMRQAGFTKTQIDRLIGAYDQLPKETIIPIKTPGIGTALSNLKILRKLAGDQGALHGFGGGGSARHGGIFAAAKGAITKMATGGTITSSPTVLFGERGVGKEGFVPQNGISQSRAASLLSTMASWHDLAVTPMGSNSQPVSVAVYLDGQPIYSIVDKVLVNQARQLTYKPRTVL